MKTILVLLFAAVLACAVNATEDNVMDHEYHVHVYHPPHEVGASPEADDEDQVDVHIHNKRAKFFPDKVQNYIIHIHEDDEKEKVVKQQIGHDSTSEEEHHEENVLDNEHRAQFYSWHNKLYRYFVQDHEEHYDFAECDIVADRTHSEDAVLSGRVVFKQNRNGGPLHYQVELHGFTPDHPDHAMHINTYGDIINGCSNVGGIYNPFGVEHGDHDSKVRAVGNLGNIHANEKGELLKEFSDDHAFLHGRHSIVGRSLVIDSHADGKEGEENHHMACCIIALSPGENWHEDWPHA